MRSCLFSVFLFLIFSSCGVGNTHTLIKDIPKQEQTKGAFYITTSESKLTSYNIVKNFNLYKLIPHLDVLDMTIDSYEEVLAAVRHASRFEKYNVAVLVKSDDCMAEFGYCKAYLINQNM